MKYCSEQMIEILSPFHSASALALSPSDASIQTSTEHFCCNYSLFEQFRALSDDSGGGNCLIDQSDRRGDYEIWSHEVFKENVTERVYLVDTWQRGRPKHGNDLFPDKLDNFHGNQLKAVTFEHAPSIVDIHDEEGHHSYDGGSNGMGADVAEDSVGFNLLIVVATDFNLHYHSDLSLTVEK